MAYNLFIDRQNEFQARIKLQGASLRDSFCRVVVESDDFSIMFPGNISKKGSVTVPIKKLRGLLDEGDTGQIKLEVIAEDTYFLPWQSDFSVSKAKSVQVEVKQSSTQMKPKAIVEVEGSSISRKDKRVYLKEYMQQLKKYKITLYNVTKKKPILDKITEAYFSKNNVDESTRKWILESTLKILDKTSI